MKYVFSWKSSYSAQAEEMGKGYGQEAAKGKNADGNYAVRDSATTHQLTAALFILNSCKKIHRQQQSHYQQKARQ